MVCQEVGGIHIMMDGTLGGGWHTYHGEMDDTWGARWHMGSQMAHGEPDGI